MDDFVTERNREDHKEVEVGKDVIVSMRSVTGRSQFDC